MSIGLQTLRAVIESGATSEVRHLSAELFLPNELPAYEFVTAHFRRHGRLPSVQACNENQFALTPAPEPVTYYRERLLHRAIYNTVAANIGQFQQSVRDRDMPGLIEWLNTTHGAVGRYAAREDHFTLRQLLDEVMADYEQAHLNPGMQGITLGWDELDAITNGAEPGDIVTLAARPGMGKSWLLLWIAMRAWLTGRSILFVSMEMTARQMARRFLGMNARINPDMIRRGQLSMWAHQAALDSIESAESGAPWHFISGSFDKSVPLVDAAVQEFTPDLIIVDASYLMSPANKGNYAKRANWEQAADVSKELKQMAMARQRPLIQTVQLNRSATQTKKRGTEHVAGSDAVGQITTTLIDIAEGEAPYERTRRRLNVTKNREGSTGGFVDVNFLFEPPDFTAVVDEQQQAASNVGWMI